MNRRNFLIALAAFTAGAAAGSVLLPLTGPPPKSITLKCAPPPEPTAPPYYQGPTGFDREQHIALIPWPWPAR